MKFDFFKFLCIIKSGGTALSASEKIVQIPNFLSRKISPPQWIVPDFVVKSHYHLLVAPPKMYKSTFSLYIAKQAASVGVRVIYVDLENSDQIISERFKWLKIHNDSNIIIWNESSEIPLEARPIGRLDAGYYDACDGNTLWIFDSIIRFHNRPENDSWEMAKVERFFRGFTRQGDTVWAIHHSGKSHDSRDSAVRGSSELSAGPDAIYSIAYSTSKTLLPKISMEHRGGRFAAEWTKDFYLDREQGRFIPEDEYEPGLVQNIITKNPDYGTDELIKMLNKEHRFTTRKARQLLAEIPHKKIQGKDIYIVE